MKILLAVDSTTTLNILLDEMMTRSWPGGTEARVLSIVEDDEVSLETWREKGYGVSAVRQEMRKRGEDITALAVDRLRAMGIPAEVAVMRGNPGFLISVEAKKWRADMILIRAHNRTDFRNWMLGSVAKSVIESAPCSVDVIRVAGEPHAVEGNPGMRILLATDGSQLSLAAARTIAETRWPEHSEVKVVNVINPMVYSLEEIGLLSDKGTERAHRAIGEAIGVLKGTPLMVSGEIIAGGTERQIIDRAKKWDADLIVVGTHQRRGLKRLLFGSTSDIVANRAHCSVRIIRGRDVSDRRYAVPGLSGPSPQHVGRVYRLTDDDLGWRRAA
ncbi:MAG TPA: universal stress protein [Pyrinomonadaceae bacterium]|nr:universal stress protein [Pyrinomonadaceae bacterium]